MPQIFLALMLFISTVSRAADDPTYTVSVQTLNARPGEVVAAFEIDLIAGTFDQVSNLPVGWYVVLDNDASWLTKITGRALVGAASLTVDQFKQLRFRVRKREFGDLKFSVSGTVALTADFEQVRPLPLQVGDFLMMPGR